MRNLLLLTFCFFLVFVAHSQPEDKKILFEVGTNPFGSNVIEAANSTSLYWIKAGGERRYAVGAEGGLFLDDYTVLKVGLGYTHLGFTDFISYRLGIKYYTEASVPLQLDFTSATVQDFVDPVTEETVTVPSPFWIGIQAGYAFFLNDYFTFEPALRYNMSLNPAFTDRELLEIRLSLVLML